MPEDNFDSKEERQQAEIARLYAVHKDHGTLGVFYQMYPDLAPPKLARSGPDLER